MTSSSTTTPRRLPRRGIQMTENALAEVRRLCEGRSEDLILRVGVKGGGCSGLTYTMDFEDAANIGERDEVFDHDGFKLVSDKKSLLFLYGLVLDYSDELLGGGFQFNNPNAERTCSCGSSFSA
ncbi:HesB/IscA family protein [Gloeobacter kilaueensis]|uniref:Iron-sulfur cluster assembly accessory protein n=1 Tax=Gloeobacter kilaueensis (strain ATCC BAA-2537 / CCAP 1431/1 / ULC 316 / JS1) TaxID=1183438 RepID=U5QPS2_GLOK1|nr:iron-sulfur cluster assembly accessory protein [Gloeobacter kilaueensis]AGY59695.1 iron-sulfur cluster assembly accessory protein [Gloeobacter kilaueensis JS1]